MDNTQQVCSSRALGAQVSLSHRNSTERYCSLQASMLTSRLRPYTQQNTSLVGAIALIDALSFNVVLTTHIFFFLRMAEILRTYCCIDNCILLSGIVHYRWTVFFVTALTFMMCRLIKPSCHSSCHFATPPGSPPSSPNDSPSGE